MPQEVVIIGKDGQEHVFPAGFDPRRAAEIVRRQTGGSSMASGTANVGRDLLAQVMDTARSLRGSALSRSGIDTAAPIADQLAQVDRAESRRVAPAIGQLPAIGSAVGGVLGTATPVGPIGGAAIGGAAGETLRQLETNTPNPMGVVTEGAIGAAGEGAGQMVVRGARSAAPWMMERALNLTDRLAKEFPDLPTVMLDNALTVSRNSLKSARAMLVEARNVVKAKVTAAERAGVKVPIQAATDGLDRTLARVMDSEDIEGGLQALAEVEQNIKLGRAGVLSPTEAENLKRSLQTRSKALYRAREAGNGPPNTSVKAEALADMAANLNAEMDRIFAGAGEAGYNAGNATVQDFIGATRGISRGTRQGQNIFHSMVRPGLGLMVGGAAGEVAGGNKGAAGGALAGAYLNSPQGMSRLAVAITRPAVQAALRQAPRLATAVARMLAESGAGSAGALDVPPPLPGVK